MAVFALFNGYFGPALPNTLAAVLWIVLASIVGGLWSLADHWLQRRADRVSWDTLCYSWPTAMTLTWPVLAVAETSRWDRHPFSEPFEVIAIIFVVLNMPAMIVSLLFVFSPFCGLLIWMVSRIATPDWSLVLIAGPVFWITWFWLLRRLEDRWTYRIYNITK